MSFEDALDALSEKVRLYRASLETEEATKTAIIMPFIGQVLGYDVFNPQEVIPEFVADIGLKKGEKIDFAVVRDGDVQMLIEAKKIGDPLNLDHAGQLIRYFHTSNARIGVLTNGQVWHFYTDLDKPNRMDEKPFLRLDLLDIDPYTLPELLKLTKSAFDLDSVLLAAEELKYVSSLKRVVADLFETPSDDFVKLLTARVYEGSYTQRVRELFTPLCEKAQKQFVTDRVNARLKSALGGSAPAVPAVTDITAQAGTSGTSQPEDSAGVAKDGIETTVEEIEGFNIIRAIVAEVVPFDRVVTRDAKSYCAVLLDDNNRKPICRLHFNAKQLYVGLLDEAKVETRMPLGRVEDLYLHAEQLRETVRRYL